MNTTIYPIRNFWVKVYKADNAIYKDGQMRQISCNHVKVDTHALNNVGDIVTLGGTDINVHNGVPTGQYEGVMLEHGTIIPPTGQVIPNPLLEAQNLIQVYQIKDMSTLSTYYVDAESYTANVVTCNPSNHN